MYYVLCSKVLCKGITSESLYIEEHCTNLYTKILFSLLSWQKCTVLTLSFCSSAFFISVLQSKTNYTQNLYNQVLYLSPTSH